MTVAQVGMNRGTQLTYVVCFAVGLVGIALALLCWGAAEVRANPGEVFFLTAIGGVWLFPPPISDIDS